MPRSWSGWRKARPLVREAPRLLSRRAGALSLHIRSPFPSALLSFSQGPQGLYCFGHLNRSSLCFEKGLEEHLTVNFSKGHMPVRPD